jgi:hypothetical protein
MDAMDILDVQDKPSDIRGFIGYNIDTWIQKNMSGYIYWIYRIYWICMDALGYI